MFITKTKTSLSQRTHPPISLIIGVLLWLFLLYGRILYQATPEQMQSLWQLLGPFVLLIDFLNPLFGSPLAFIVGYTLGMGMIIWGLIKFFAHTKWRWLLLAFALSGLLFHFVMPTAYGSYQLPVQATAGYQLHWITEPTNRYSSAFKQAQQSHEGSCAYHLSGWTSATTLAYTSACWPGTWQHNLTTGATNWALLANITVGEEDVYRGSENAYPSSPGSLREAGKYPYLTLERAISPDKQWEAVVIRWFYGPSDIVIVGRVDD